MEGCVSILSEVMYHAIQCVWWHNIFGLMNLNMRISKIISYSYWKKHASLCSKLFTAHSYMMTVLLQSFLMHGCWKKGDCFIRVFKMGTSKSTWIRGALLSRQSVKRWSLYHADYPAMRYCEAPHLECLSINLLRNFVVSIYRGCRYAKVTHNYGFATWIRWWPEWRRQRNNKE